MMKLMVELSAGESRPNNFTMANAINELCKSFKDELCLETICSMILLNLENEKHGNPFTDYGIEVYDKE